MDKFNYFLTKFEENIKGRSMQEAFDKTNKDVGFEAYSSYQSFSTVRKRKRKK